MLVRPSRCNLLTGRNSGHAYIRGNVGLMPYQENVKEPGSFPIPETLPTLGELFKKAGHINGVIGKWGLGNYDNGGDPQKHGFDCAIRNWKGVKTGLNKNAKAPWQLYNLETDERESKDVAAEHPELLIQFDAIVKKEHHTPVRPEWDLFNPNRKPSEDNAE